MLTIMLWAAALAAKDANTTYEFEERRIMLSAEYRKGRARYCRFQVGGHLGSANCDWIEPFVRSAWAAYTDRPLPANLAVSFETAVEPGAKPKTFPRAVPAGGAMVFYQAMSAEVAADGTLEECSVTVATDDAPKERCAWPAYYAFDPLPAKKSARRSAQLTVGIWTEARLSRLDSDTGYIGTR